MISGGQPPASEGPVRFSEDETTGRFLVFFEEHALEAAANELKNATGIDAVMTFDADSGGFSPDDFQSAESVIFEHVGAALVRGEPDQAEGLHARGLDASSAIRVVEPERIVYAHATGPQLDLGSEAPQERPRLSREFMQGYKAAVDHLTSLAGTATAEGAALDRLTPSPFADIDAATWGLQATGVTATQFSGEGIRVAVLDSGMDLRHPDFANRPIVHRSFVEGEETRDGFGHGTHCVGTACGPVRPETGPRYGVASGAEIYVGKVLSDRGRGDDGTVLAALDWAIANGCRVVSMSLGKRVTPEQRHSAGFELVAGRALSAGTLLVASVGNHSDRPDQVVAVSHPANCPSVMAVAALDSELGLAWFSNAGLDPNGGQVDIAGPGVGVYSSFPMPLAYRHKDGTSMAAPHVAGVAALLAQAHPGATGAELFSLVTRAAQRLRLSSNDVGAGLVRTR